MVEVLPVVSKGFDSNVYLIQDERKVVIDTGMGSRELLKEVERHTALEDVELIVNTHAHADHVMGNPAFKNAKVLIHEEDAEALAGGHLYSTARMFDIEGNLEYHRSLKDGEGIPLGEGELKVIHTPGHTPGSISLYLEEERALFTGDLVFAEGSFGRTDFGGNSKELKISLRRVAELDVESLYPGHMDIVERGANSHILMAKEIVEEFL